MIKNMGTADRSIRAILALFVLVFYLASNNIGLAAIILGIFALIFFVSVLQAFVRCIN